MPRRKGIEVNEGIAIVSNAFLLLSLLQLLLQLLMRPF